MSEPTRELNVLFVDDERDNLEAFIFNCEEFWNTHTSTSPLDIMGGQQPLDDCDAIIVDLVFRDPNNTDTEPQIGPGAGLKFLAWLQKTHPQLPTLVLSAFLSDDIRRTIKADHPKVLCLDKPLDFSTGEFRNMIRKFIVEYRS